MNNKIIDDAFIQDIVKLAEGGKIDKGEKLETPAAFAISITSTIDCIIELEFDTETLLKDEVMLLIGFKEK